MKNLKRKIFSAPSLLSGDFSNMEKSLNIIEECGGDWVHVDVMDGSFVPVITFGPKMVNDLRPKSKLVFDVHLMVNNPENQIEQFAKAGSDYITIHYESTTHINSVLQRIKSLGCKCGISIVPSTPVSILENILPFVDLVLVMSVNPGFGGQELILDCLNKVEKLVDIRDKLGYNYLISIDGGVNPKTAKDVILSGVDVFVTGSAFFGSENPSAVLEQIKNCK